MSVRLIGGGSGDGDWHEPILYGDREGDDCIYFQSSAIIWWSVRQTTLTCVCVRQNCVKTLKFIQFDLARYQHRSFDTFNTIGWYLLSFHLQSPSSCSISAREQCFFYHSRHVRPTVLHHFIRWTISWWIQTHHNQIRFDILFHDKIEGDSIAITWKIKCTHMASDENDDKIAHVRCGVSRHRYHGIKA